MGSTQSEVEVSYDVGNDFFRIWLDKRMNYTCALYKDAVNFSDSLEDAQMNKLHFLSELAHIGPDTKSVLDIGCGWGANLEYQATVNKVPVVQGITLSSQQFDFCVKRDLPNTSVALCNYLNFQPPLRFDAIMSICMIEHIVSPEEARAGRAIDIYRDYFRRAHGWSNPGSYFALQVITRNQVPRNRQDLDDLRHGTYTIFPGAVTPRVEDIVAAVTPYYEVITLHSRRWHYHKTLTEWRERMRAQEADIRKTFGDAVYLEYDRYLSTYIRGYEKNWMSLHQFELKRLD